MSNKWMPLNIQLFAEGSDGAVTGAESSQPQTGATNDAGTEPAGAPDAEGQNSNTDGVNQSHAESLDDIIGGSPELKKQFDEKIRKIIGQKNAQSRAKMKPANDILDKMMVLHGVKTVEELGAKLDETLPGEFAIKHGVSEDMGGEMLNMRVKSMRDDRMSDYYAQQKKAERQLAEWEKEAETVKGVYNGFDLRSELENPDFRRLLSASDPQYRMPMKQIYELIHHDELVKAAEDRAAQAYANSVNANMSRPVENGAGSKGAVSNQFNVSKLTKKERAELAKRAQRGETISFN